MARKPAADPKPADEQELTGPTPEDVGYDAAAINASVLERMTPAPMPGFTVNRDAFLSGGERRARERREARKQ